MDLTIYSYSKVHLFQELYHQAKQCFLDFISVTYDNFSLTANENITFKIRTSHKTTKQKKITIQKCWFDTSYQLKGCFSFPKGTLKLTNEPHQEDYSHLLNMTIRSRDQQEWIYFESFLS